MKTKIDLIIRFNHSILKLEVSNPYQEPFGLWIMQNWGWFYTETSETKAVNLTMAAPRPMRVE